MKKTIRIRLLGACEIRAPGKTLDHLEEKSRKGIGLMEYLILQRGKTVPAPRLIREMWMGRKGENPEGALKTMVSRLRGMMNTASPGLGGCIVSESGGYRWESLPGVRVDVLEMLEAAEAAREEQDPEKRKALCRRVTELYGGDLVETGDMTSSAMYISWLHRLYLEVVYGYLEQLRAEGDFAEISRVCRAALEIDGMDERLHRELESADALRERRSEAEEEFRPAGEAPGEAEEAPRQEDGLYASLERIREELTARESERHGPFFCDFKAFQEFYNIQMRNLERLGSTMFLGVIMVGGEEEAISPVSRESAMAGLMEILRGNLRKGDIVTRYAPDMIAMLLPGVSYASGGMVMERISRIFEEEYPNRNIGLRFRITPLGEAAK